MPADITKKDGKDLVAVNVTRGHPWHQLGVPVQKDMTKEEALEAVGVLQENVRLIPLWYNDPNEMFEEADEEDILGVMPTLDIAPGIHGVYSNVFGYISAVGDRWHPTQRREILDVAYEIVGLSNEAAHIDTIGNLGEAGDTFFAYIRVPDLVIDPEGIADTIERGLFVGTSFDLSLPNTIGWSNIRPVCRNGVSMALGRLKQTIRVKHTRHSQARIQEAAIALQYVGAVEKEVKLRAERMLQVRNGEDALRTLQDHFWDLSDESLSDNALTQRTRNRNMVERLYEGPNNVQAVGRNGWAAYNAVVEFFDHERDVKGKNPDLNRARGAVLPGKVVKDKIRASELVLDLL